MRKGPDVDHQRDEVDRSARARRRGISYWDEVVVCSEAVGEAEVRIGERRRVRAGDVQGPRDLPHDPHSVIEGTMIAGLAVGAKMGFIYLRGEYRYLLKIMEKAVAEAYAKGFLGKNIFGIGAGFRHCDADGRGRVRGGRRVGADGVAGGKRGIPRIRPPFPAVVGLYGGPTIINNAETIANVPHILLMGGEAYAKMGTERNGGTRLFCISGHVERPGVYELPMGYTLRKVIYEVGGGIQGGKQLKAVVPAVRRARCCARKRLSGAGLRPDGKAGIDAGVGRRWWCWTRRCRMVEFALRTIKFYQHESCGWCIPCREGTDWLKKTLTRVHAGGGEEKDIDNMQYLAENMMGRTFCPLGDAAAMPTLGFVKKFRKEFEDHIDGKKAGTPVMSTEDWLERVIEPEGPSNFVVFAMVVVAVVLVWFAWTRTHPQRSADQKILIEKSHQH